MIPLLIKLLLNKYTLIASMVVAAFAAGYVKGRLSVHVQEEKVAVQEIQQCEVAEQKIEVAHDQRVRKILSHDVPDADASRMLSTWPDQASPVGATVP